MSDMYFDSNTDDNTLIGIINDWDSLSDCYYEAVSTAMDYFLIEVFENCMEDENFDTAEGT